MPPTLTPGNVLSKSGGSMSGDIELGPAALTAGTAQYVAVAYSRRAIHKFRITNAMVVAAAGTSAKLTLCTLPAKTIVHHAHMAVVTAATQAATLTGQVGPSDDTDGYVVASSLKAAANTVYGDANAELGDDLFSTVALNPLKSYTTTTTVQVEFVIGDGTLADVTACVFDVYLDCTILP